MNLNFKEWLETSLQSTDWNDTPEQWIERKRLCKYCGQPVHTLGSASGGNYMWAICKNPECESRKKELKGFLEPNETEPEPNPSPLAKMFRMFDKLRRTL